MDSMKHVWQSVMPDWQTVRAPGNPQGKSLLIHGQKTAQKQNTIQLSIFFCAMSSANESSIQRENALQLDVESIKFFLNQLEELLIVLKKFGSNVIGHIHSAVEKINSLEDDKSNMRDALNDCKKKLSETQNKASLFRNRMHAFFRSVDTDEMSFKKIQESLLRNDKTLLEFHLKTLTRYLMQCVEFYEDFQKVHQETEILCRKTSRECESMKKKAKNRKYTARAAGLGGAALGVGGVVGGGIALCCGWVFHFRSWHCCWASSYFCNCYWNNRDWGWDSGCGQRELTLGCTKLRQDTADI